MHAIHMNFNSSFNIFRFIFRFGYFETFFWSMSQNMSKELKKLGIIINGNENMCNSQNTILLLYIYFLKYNDS